MTILWMTYALALVLFAWWEFSRQRPVSGFMLLGFATLTAGQFTVPAYAVALVLWGAALWLRWRERRYG